MDTSPEVWFSHRERKWEVKDGKLLWMDKEEIWDWDNCTIKLARTLEDKLKLVVRSKTNKNSRYMGEKPVDIRFMMGFDAIKVFEPRIETYTARKDHTDPKKTEGPRERWVFELNDEHWIWEWAKEGEDISSSNIYKLYQLINEEISNSSIKSSNIFDVEIGSEDDRIIPVIYQPAVDALDNFVRKVHCAQSEREDGSYEVEVTIIFNNEDLCRHSYGGILNKSYEGFRHLYHGRTLDIESFNIIVRKGGADNRFVFENIYSDQYTLEEDNIHGDPPTAPERRINYYFNNQNHPVIFINTSNHAMAEHDTNHRIWKWEYVPWADNTPIKYGNKTRKEIEKSFKPLLKFW